MAGYPPLDMSESERRRRAAARPRRKRQGLRHRLHFAAVCRVLRALAGLSC